MKVRLAGKGKRGRNPPLKTIPEKCQSMIDAFDASESWEDSLLVRILSAAER